MSRILAFSGSARKASFNQKLVTVAAQGARNAGADVTVISLADYPMPIFDQDLEDEQGIPQKALEFKQLLIDHDGFLIASPEYNSAFSPLLKNAIDWASRPSVENEAPLIAYRGKTASIMAASPRGLGGMRGLVFLRMLLGNLGMIVLPQQQAVSQAHKVFDKNGTITDAKQEASILALGENLVKALK